MREDLKELNKALTRVIASNCEGKEKILLTLSGGMDTRLVLSILLKNGIRPDVMTWDGSPGNIVIAKRIAYDEGLNLIIVHKKTKDRDWLIEVNKIIDKYDVIFYGELMSEVFNKFVRFTESEKKLNDIITNYFKWVEENKSNLMDKKAFPCLDKTVMAIVENMPICLRVYGYINRRLIALNYPSLLNYPHTVVNMRYRLMEVCYWMVIPIFEMWCK